MTDFFDDNPFDDVNKDDPFASGSASGGGLGNLGDEDLGLPSFGETSADMPENLVRPPRSARSRNRSFVAVLALLAVVMVLGLGAILYAAIQNTNNTNQINLTRTAVAFYNSGIQTSVAATTTAKSWTLTPSRTPVPTDTPTFTATNTPSPTNTPVPTNTPIPTITNTFPPDITPPTITVTPLPVTPATFVPPNQDAQNTQSAALQAAVTAFSVQETANAHSSSDTRPTLAAKQTQASEFNAAQTAISGQLTEYAQVATSAASGGNGQAVTPTATPSLTVCDLSPTATPEAGTTAIPLNCISPTPTLAETAAGLRLGIGSVPVIYIEKSQRQPNGQPQLQDTAEPTAPVNTPSQIQGASPTALSGTLVAATATSQYLRNQEQTLVAAQSALSQQLTLNAMTATPQETENAQFALGLTAIAVQLNADAALEGTLVAIVQKVPTTGLYEDLASGKANPGSLTLVGVAAIGLVGVIVVARRLRVK